MKTAPAKLIALLNSLGGTAPVYVADLYTLTLLGGAVLRYTSADIDVRVGANTFTSRDLKIERSKIKWSTGVQVDELDVTLWGDASNLILGQPFIVVAANGGLDGATLRLDQAFMADWSAAYGDLTNYVLPSQFIGTLSDIEVSRNQVKLKVKSLLELLNIQMPRNVYIPPCIHTLYDAGCGLNRASFSDSGTVSSATSTVLTVTGMTRNAGWYDGGYLVWATGANAGVECSIKSSSGSPAIALTVTRPLLSIPVAGDTFTIYAGCDKLQATCSGKFSNLTKFRGFPYIPAAEVSVV